MKTMITALLMAPLSVLAHPGHSGISGHESQLAVLAIALVVAISLPLLAKSLRRVRARNKKD